MGAGLTHAQNFFITACWAAFCASGADKMPMRFSLLPAALAAAVSLPASDALHAGSGSNVLWTNKLREFCY
jgi:hypothetical protein